MAKGKKVEHIPTGISVCLVYTGRVMSVSNTLIHKYIAQDGPEKGKDMIFNSKLLGSETIGTVIRGERTDKGMKAPYSFVGVHKNRKEIAEWSGAEAAAVAEKDLLQAAKQKHPEHIDTFIDNIKRGYSGHQRRLIALYIFNKLANFT